jgi:type II secretion system protein H
MKCSESTKKMGENPAGFSLIELMVVVTIVGIMLAVAVYSSSRMVGDARIKGTAEQLAQSMREARERAVSRGHQVELAFASTGLHLTTATVYHQAAPDTVQRELYGNSSLGLRPVNPPTSRPPDGLPAGAPAGGIDFANNRALFTPQGGCNPGAVYLFGRDGRVQMAVSVNINGRVRTWRWDNGAWY